MLKQSGTGVTAVKQFVDKFEKLQGDQNQLEDALTSFGGQWDWLVASDQVAGGQPVVQTPVTVTSTQHLISSQQSLNSPPPDLTSPKVSSFWNNLNPKIYYFLEEAEEKDKT